MAVIHEPNNLGDLLKYEADNLYSREEVKVANGQKLELGAVVIKDKDGLTKAFDPAGKEKPVGVIFESITSSGEAKSLIITRHAILADHAVVWPAGITLEQKQAAIKELESRGITIRKGV